VILTIVEGPDEGTKYEFEQKEILIGSDFSNDLILNHLEVSPRHAKIVEEKDGVYLEDRGSLHGTKLNGLYVRREPLHNGDELQIGMYVFHLSLAKKATEEKEKAENGPEKRGLLIKRFHSVPKRLIIIVLFGIVLVYASFRIFANKEDEGQDLSKQGPVPLPAQGIYGYKVGGQNYVDKIEFSFIAKGPKYRLLYRSGFIQSPGSVEISLNDKKLVYVPLTINRWADDPISVDLPQDVLKKGEVNIIRFNNTKNPPANERWGIRDVSLVDVPLPRCDVDVAQRYFELANKKYEERRINEPNLFYAIESLKQGLEYVITCEDPKMKNLILDSLNQYEQELERHYKDYMFNARKFIELHDLEAAQFELDALMKHIPDEDDARHKRAKDLLDRLSRR
jgi:pSer/pThr/pTyr-binding forkhead associated (FHA) protein